MSSTYRSSRSHSRNRGGARNFTRNNIKYTRNGAVNFCMNLATDVYDLAEPHVERLRLVEARRCGPPPRRRNKRRPGGSSRSKKTTRRTRGGGRSSRSSSSSSSSKSSSSSRTSSTSRSVQETTTIHSSLVEGRSMNSSRFSSKSGGVGGGGYCSDTTKSTSSGRGRQLRRGRSPTKRSNSMNAGKNRATSAPKPLVAKTELNNTDCASNLQQQEVQRRHSSGGSDPKFTTTTSPTELLVESSSLQQSYPPSHQGKSPLQQGRYRQSIANDSETNCYNSNDTSDCSSSSFISITTQTQQPSQTSGEQDTPTISSMPTTLQENLSSKEGEEDSDSVESETACWSGSLGMDTTRNSSKSKGEALSYKHSDPQLKPSSLLQQSNDVTILVGKEPNQRICHFNSHVLLYISEYFSYVMVPDTNTNLGWVIDFSHKNVEEWNLFYPFLEPPAKRTVFIDIDNLPLLLPWFHEFNLPLLLHQCDILLSSITFRPPSTARTEDLQDVLLFLYASLATGT